MNKRIIKTFTMFAMIFVLMLSMPVTSEAKTKSAKSILNTAIKKIKNSPSISCKYDRTENGKDSSGSYTTYRTGFISSDNKYDYGMFYDENESGVGWFGYDYKNISYRKAFTEKEWNKYVFNNGSSLSLKKTMIQNLSKLTNLQISSISSKSYTVTGKLSASTSGQYKSASIVINKKSGRITKIKYTLRKNTFYYANEGGKYTVKGGATTLSNICYGDNTLSLPVELRGK